MAHTRERTVLFLLYDGVQSLDVTGPLEVFVNAARYRPGAYRVRTATLDGGPVRTCSGLSLAPDTALDAAEPPHTVVIPGGDGTRVLVPGLVEWLCTHAAHAVNTAQAARTTRAERLVSVCTGAFLLAEAGLLDGRRATTHWKMCAELAERYPNVRVDPEPIYIRDGDIATSAGVTAGIDLALALVEEDLGRDIALRVARHLVVYMRRPGNQAQFSAQLAVQTAERAPLREVQHWIAENPSADLRVEALAARADLSPRHFARAFHAEVGMTPGRFVDQVRLEAARRRLEDTDDGIEETSRRCGYGTPEAMRRAFIRALDTAPAEYRRRFRPGRRT